MFCKVFLIMRPPSITTLKPGIIDSLAISAITGYQRYLSPHKGFRCAHRVLHQGESCSQYVKRAVREEGLVTALRCSRVRFAECHEANRVIRERRQKYLLSISSGGGLAIEDESEEIPLTGVEPEDNSGNSAASNCNGFDGSCIEASCDGVDFLSGETSECLSSSTSDCGSVSDCGSCDLAGLDCGGCSW
jgi:putative component of membrane protein insertase Oxa1/YidC/SpoIIIJ protein YidD